MLFFLASSLFATAFAAERPTCGIQGPRCPDGLVCQYDTTCDTTIAGADCSGICVGETPCGGLRGGTLCPDAEYCVDDPYDTCDPLNGGADCSGFCIRLGYSCSLCDMSTMLGAPSELCPDKQTCFGNCGTCTWEDSSTGPMCSRLVPQDRVCPVTTTTLAADTTTTTKAPDACGGSAGTQCADGLACQYDTMCDPTIGGAVCSGICVDETTTTTTTTTKAPDACGGSAGTQCADGLACQYDTSICDPTSGTAADCSGICIDETTTTTTTTPSGCVCTQEWKPFCCREQTYGNACEAECAGFAADTQCAVGDCPVTGCDTCPRYLAPVCCGDQTYGNPCLAQCAGFTADSGCTGGVCSSACICTMDFSPVCCDDDGNTYGNECAAKCNGFSGCNAGVCLGSACGGIQGIQCADGLACQYDTSICDPAGGFAGGADCGGICVAATTTTTTRAPDTTTTTKAPDTCGGIAGTQCADGLACQYDTSSTSACDPTNGGADCSGICVAETTTTKAPDTCGGLAGIQCADGLTCQYDTSICDPANGGTDCSGTCGETTTTLPACTCTADFAPVCCDGGNTYSNECAARCDGFTGCNVGVCLGELCGGLAGIQCADGLTCQYDTSSTSACDPTNGGADCGGICVAETTTTTTACDCPTDEFAPVCCNGLVFGNACRARCSGYDPTDPDICTVGECPTTGPVTTTTTTTTACDCPTDEFAPVCCSGLVFGNACRARCSDYDPTNPDICQDGECPSTTRDPETTRTTEEACFCTQQYAPVCCGETTYSNACAAECADLDSTDPDICTDGECPIATTTTEAGCICTEEYAPVCCGGTTYSNGCNARCDGLNPNDPDICQDGECDDDLGSTAMPETTTPSDSGLCRRYNKAYRFLQEFIENSPFCRFCLYDGATLAGQPVCDRLEEMVSNVEVQDCFLEICELDCEFAQVGLVEDADLSVCNCDLFVCGSGPGTGNGGGAAQQSLMVAMVFMLAVSFLSM